MLVELPSGDWLDPTRVCGIRHYEIERGQHGVNVDLPDQIGHFFVRFENETAAVAWAKEFGTMINNLRKPPEPIETAPMDAEVAAELVNFRNIIANALAYEGLRMQGGGVGFGQADASFELPDGRTLEITVEIAA